MLITAVLGPSFFTIVVTIETCWVCQPDVGGFYVSSFMKNASRAFYHGNIVKHGIGGMLACQVESKRLHKLLSMNHLIA
ncbi:hypothetical protein GGR52DRAFT_555487 [Hypoxylon sp. FL1284]|nr:hypothetical protein GGR52DRAFT_555487 [Hypoxylon sp. FL1284]